MTRQFLAGIVMALILALVALAGSTNAAGPTTVGLGTATNFAVLAGSGITNTGPTTINGDVGSYPTTTQTGFGSITLIGTNHMGDAVTQGAKTDLTTAYNDAAGRTPVTTVPTELGGTTLTAGTYTAASGTFGITGNLTLNGQGDPNAVFIFKMASTLTTATSSSVTLIGGAQSCNVFWQVGSSATLGGSTHFKGNILALTSITLVTSATVDGRVLARNGAVTLDTNTITKATCAVAPTAAPTTTPTATPTSAPTEREETPAPTAKPTIKPTSTPTATPTNAQFPTAAPTTTPKATLIVAPTAAPSVGSLPSTSTVAGESSPILGVALFVAVALLVGIGSYRRSRSR